MGIRAAVKGLQSKRHSDELGQDRPTGRDYTAGRLREAAPWSPPGCALGTWRRAGGGCRSPGCRASYMGCARSPGDELPTPGVGLAGHRSQRVRPKKPGQQRKCTLLEVLATPFNHRDPGRRIERVQRIAGEVDELLGQHVVQHRLGQVEMVCIVRATARPITPAGQVGRIRPRSAVDGKHWPRAKVRPAQRDRFDCGLVLTGRGWRRLGKV